MPEMNSNTLSNSHIVKSLDSEYRRRWELYITPSKVYDSREINWKDIPRDKIYKIESHVEGKVYVVDNLSPNFMSFIRWRFGGHEWIDGVKQKIDVWCIGFTDGETCFMKEIQFKDGSMKEAEYPLERFKNHLE